MHEPKNGGLNLLKNMIHEIFDLLRLHHIKILTLGSPEAIRSISSSLPVRIVQITPDNVDLVENFRGPVFIKKFLDFLRKKI